MSEQRERWNGVSSDSMAFAEKSVHKGATIGASQKKHTVAFVPLKDSEFNGGMGKSFAYSHLYTVDFSLDYSELVIWFTGHKVTVTGRNLKSTLDGIEAHLCELVEQGDSLQNAARDGAVVEGLELEVIGED